MKIIREVTHKIETKRYKLQKTKSVPEAKEVCKSVKRSKLIKDVLHFLAAFDRFWSLLKVT